MDRLPANLAALIEPEPNTGCWLWAGFLKGGYGCWTPGRTVFGLSQYVHRAVYQLLVGHVPAGKQLDHLCRTPSCVNPRHLEPVTPIENVRRSRSANGAKTHCLRGHPYDEANTMRTKIGRNCRACSRAATRAWQARKKAA